MFPRILACLLIGIVPAAPVLGERTPHERPVRIRTVALTQTQTQIQEPSVSSYGSLPGIVQPSQRVELISQTDGILSRIEVREGDQIQAGQVLAKFDDAMAQASVRVAAASAGPAEIELARVDLKLANAELRRLLSIPDPRALAAVEVDRAKASVERAQASVNQAKQLNLRAVSSLELEQQRLQQLYLKAPFDGVVVRISTQVGASLVRGMPIITVANLSTLKVELFADLKHFTTLRTGQHYLLHAASPVDRPLVGRLASREPVIDAATRTFRCVFEIPNTNRELPAGFTVQFNGETASSSVADTRSRLRVLRTGHK